METYYTLEEELALLEEINVMLKGNTPYTTGVHLNSLAQEVNSFPSRFHKQELFMRLPIDLLQMGEVRMNAKINGWEIEEAIDDSHFRNFIEPTQNKLREMNADALMIHQGMQKYLMPRSNIEDKMHAKPKTQAIVEKFAPLYHCTRAQEEAYISTHNMAYSLPTGKIMSSGINLVLDKGNGLFIWSTPVTLYLPVMKFDLEEHEELKEFWKYR